MTNKERKKYEQDILSCSVKELDMGERRLGNLLRDLEERKTLNPDMTEVFIKVRATWSKRGYQKMLGVKGEQIQELYDGIVCCFDWNVLYDQVTELKNLVEKEKQSREVLE